MNTNWHDWRIDRDRRHFLQWLEENNLDASRLDIDSILEEGWRDWAKTAGRIGQGAAMMGALAGPFASLPEVPKGPPASMQPRPAAAARQEPGQENPFQVVEEDPQEIKRKFDQSARPGQQMSDSEWRALASRYPGDMVGFVPNPEVPGQWIPAGGADAVRVQGYTQVNNDELGQDTVGITPYKNGQPTRPTNWSGGQPNRDISGYQAQLGVQGMRRGMRRA